jgi:hypothetical protein
VCEGISPEGFSGGGGGGFRSRVRNNDRSSLSYDSGGSSLQGTEEVGGTSNGCGGASRRSGRCQFGLGRPTAVRQRQW